MDSKQKLIDDASFWFNEYLHYRAAAMAGGDSMFNRYAEEMLDWHFELVDRAARLSETVEGAE